MIMRKRITYLRLLFLLFLPTLSTGGSHSTTWAHLSHHHDQYQFTDHVVATFCHEFSRPHCAEGQKRSSNSRFQAASISPLLGPLSCNYILSVPTFTTRILLTDHCRCARSIVERLSTVRWPDHAWLKALTGLYYSLLYGGKPKMRLRAVDSSIPSNRAFNLISFGAFLLPDH